MRSEAAFAIAVLFVLATLPAAVAWKLSRQASDDRWQRECVDEGVAEFYINDDGDRAFWFVPCEER